MYRSNDDAFMIYMALWSGTKCYLLSNDEFRQHRFTLGPEAGSLLAQWQTARQISIRSANPLTFIVSCSRYDILLYRKVFLSVVADLFCVNKSDKL